MKGEIEMESHDWLVEIIDMDKKEVISRHWVQESRFDHAIYSAIHEAQVLGKINDDSRIDVVPMMIDINKAKKEDETQIFFDIIKNNHDEYEVRVYENGVINHDRTYFTDDKEDAQLTKQAMIDEEKRNNDAV